MFTKSDLKNGDVCVQRDGTTEIYLANSPAGPVFLTFGPNGYYWWNNPAEKGRHLESVFGEKCFDIVKVFRATTPQAYGYLSSLLDENPADGWDCIFDLNAPVEMTLAEVCEALGKNIKIVKEH